MRRSLMLTALALASILAPNRGALGFQQAEVATGPRAWALVVGISEYPNVDSDGKRVRRYDCPNAVNDAQAVATWLRETAKWPADQVFLMTSTGPAGLKSRPTLKNLNAAVNDWLMVKAMPGDFVFFYYAGQAQSLPDPPVDQPEKWEAPRDFLWPSDYNTNMLLPKDGWPIEQALEPLHRKDVTMLCCLDTSTYGRGAANFSNKTSADRLLRRLARWPGWAAWIAADNGKPAPDGGRDDLGSPFRNRFLKALGTPNLRNNLAACLGALNRDREMVDTYKFHTIGSLNPGLTLWSGRVERASDTGIRPVLPRGHSRDITGLRVLSDGTTMLSSSLDSTVRLWDLKEARGKIPPRLVRTLAEPSDGVGSLAISPDESRIAARSHIGHGFWVWNRKGEEIPVDLASAPKSSRGQIMALDFLPDSRTLVTIDEAGLTVFWDVRDPSIVKVRPIGALLDRVATGPDHWVSFASTVPKPECYAVATLLDRSVRLIQADGKEFPNFGLPGLRDRTSAVDLSRDGRLLAVGTGKGQYAIYDVSGGTLPRASLAVGEFPGEKIEYLRLAGADWLAIGTDTRLQLLHWRKGQKDDPKPLDLPARAIRQITLSDDNRLLAALFNEKGKPSRVRLWRLGEDGTSREIAFKGELDKGELPAHLAFASQGRQLILGGKTSEGKGGSIRAWAIDEAVAQLWTIPREEARIKSISPSFDGKRFVRLLNDGRAFLFSFESRTSIPLEHLWNSLEFHPQGMLVGTLSPADESVKAGNLGWLAGPVLYDLDRPGDEIRAGLFEVPGDVQHIANLGLDRVRVAANGERIAVNRNPGADIREWIVWKFNKDGKGLDRLRNGMGLDQIQDFAVARSGTESVACTQALASLYEGPQLSHQLTIVDATNDQSDSFSAVAITSAGNFHNGPRTIALVTKKNGVVLWSPDRNDGKRLEKLGGTFQGAVATLTFTDDGRFLVASGQDRRFTAWKFLAGGGVKEVIMELAGSGHEGEILDVRAWPGLAMVATTGEDSTVRFWTLDGDHPQLLGTLSFVGSGWDRDAGNALNWVAYSPDGRFDCSPGGKELLRLTRSGEEIRLDQATGSFFDKNLMEQIRQAKLPELKVKDEPPPTLVLSPVSPLQDDGTSPTNLVRLELEHNVPGGLKDVRLYRNEVPVPFEDDPLKPKDSNHERWRVKLRDGENQFRVVAAGQGGTEGSSRKLDPIFYNKDNKTNPPSRLHVLAIGIDKYPKEELRLNFAVKDAGDIGALLTKLDADQNGQPGQFPFQFIKNEEVDEQRVKQELDELKKRVDNHPEDRVVIFLAGHTEQFGEDFGLLLCKETQKGKAGSILKYSTILQGLARLDAEQRLVIVDACQTDKIQQGKKAVTYARQERLALQSGLLKYPTQYILASKAVENPDLEHGLLTYALLCGLKAAKVPARFQNQAEKARLFAISADDKDNGDGDGTVTTEELNRYALTRVPLLALEYPEFQVPRGKDDEKGIPSPISFDLLHPTFKLVKLP